METNDPASTFEGRAGQRLDCLHGRQRSRPRAPRRLVRREDEQGWKDCLASHNRLTRQADKRSHLDLQIDLLAEREMTAVLQLLQDIAQHLQVKTSVTSEQLRDLMKKTDLRRLTNRLEELAEPATAATQDKSEASREELKAAS